MSTYLHTYIYIYIYAYIYVYTCIHIHKCSFGFLRIATNRAESNHSCSVNLRFRVDFTFGRALRFRASRILQDVLVGVTQLMSGEGLDLELAWLMAVGQLVHTAPASPWQIQACMVVVARRRARWSPGPVRCEVACGQWIMWTAV